jgi:thioredoxin reductase
MIDYLIIGAGPAGLQLGYYLEKHGKSYAILEAGETAGTFFKTHPRHQKLISINKVNTGYTDKEINLRWDWNSLLTEDDDDFSFQSFSERYFPSAENMVDYLRAYAELFSLKVKYNSRVKKVEKIDGLFVVKTDSNIDYRAKIVIVATGVSKPWIPQIDGVETATNYCDMDTNPEIYKNKKVLILGKGNSAFETGDALVEKAAVIHLCSPNSLKMAWSTHYVGHLRAVNNNLLDSYQLKSQNAILDADIEKISKESDGYKVTFRYRHAEDEIETLMYDHVIVCTGFKFDNSIFDESCKPALCSRGKFPTQHSNWESTNVPGLYFAGTITQYLDYKKFMSGFIHGFRYNVRSLFHLLMQSYEGQSLPQSRLPVIVEVLAADIIDRVNQTSSLWQQPGFLCDAYVRHGDHVTCYKDLPVDFVKNDPSFMDKEVFLLTLEFGQQKFDNPFGVSRIARDNSNKAENSNFLHPVIRQMKGSMLLSEHHIIEDLSAEWKEPEHIGPLMNYFHQVISSDVVVESSEALEVV